MTSCVTSYFQRFCDDRCLKETGEGFSSDLLPSLGASINQSTKLRKSIISPYDHRYRYIQLLCMISLKSVILMNSWRVSYSSFPSFFLFSLQSLGNVSDTPGNLLSMGLPIWISLSQISPKHTLPCGEHSKWLLCYRYHPHLLCCISGPKILSFDWWSQENCNQVSLFISFSVFLIPC